LSKKLRFPEIPVIARRAHFSLASSLFQSYQGVWRILQSVDSVWME